MEFVDIIQLIGGTSAQKVELIGAPFALSTPHVATTAITTTAATTYVMILLFFIFFSPLFFKTKTVIDKCYYGQVANLLNR